MVGTTTDLQAAYRAAFALSEEPALLVASGVVVDATMGARKLLGPDLVGLPAAGLPGSVTDLGNELKLLRLEKPFDDSFLRLVTNDLPALVSYVDASYRFRFANREYARWFGIAPNELQGKHIREVIGDAAFEGVRPFLERALQGERVLYERTMPYARGGERRVETSIVPDVDEQGRVRGFVAHILDVTDRFRAEERLRRSEERYRFLAESNPEYVWTARADGRFDYINQKWLDYVGMTMDEAYHSGWRHTIHPGDLPRTLRAWMESVRTGRDFAVEHRLRSGDGEYRWVASRATPMYGADGEVLQWFGASSDIHDLKVAELRFRELMAQSPLSVQIMDADGTIVAVNRAWERLWGADLDLLDGYSILGDPEIERRGVAGLVREAFQGKPVEIPPVGYVPDGGEFEGQPRWVRSFLYPVMENGAVREVVMLHEDVSDRILAEEERERLIRELQNERVRLRDLFERAPAIVGVISYPELAFEVVNERLAALVDGCATEGRPISEAFPEVETSGLVEILRYVGESGSPFEGRAVPFRFSPSAELRYIDFVFQPMRATDGHVASIFAHGIDVTDQVLARRVVEDLNAELEKRVEERTRELRAANDEMEGFTYTVSHDLRAPLRAINSTSRILEEDFGDKLPPAALAQLSRQAAAAKRMGILIDELLQLSRISRAQLRQERIDLTQMAVELASEFGSPNVYVEVQPRLVGMGDARLVRFVLQNLIENAVKFSPQGGKVEVGQTEQGAFFVRDHGVGFDMAYADKLFRPFERLVSDREFPGTGIGLTNVHRIVTRHHGRVWAEGEVGKGATFYFTLGE